MDKHILAILDNSKSSDDIVKWCISIYNNGLVSWMKANKRASELKTPVLLKFVDDIVVDTIYEPDKEVMDHIKEWLYE